MNLPISETSTSTSRAAEPDRSRELTVAVIGNPNTGKSTLFTALTGVHSRIGNYPGVTVEKKVGWFEHEGRKVRLVDLPGTYSLSPRTLDEMVSVEVLLGQQAEVGAIDVVLCIADASNLERNLYLVSQVLDLGLPTVLVLNMWDVAKSREIRIDPTELGQRLGVTVVPCEAHRRTQLDDVRNAVVRAGLTSRQPVDLFPPAFREESERLQADITQAGHNRLPGYLIERLLIDVGGPLETEYARQIPALFPEKLNQARERLNAAGCKVPSVEAKIRYAWIRKIVNGVVTVPRQRPVTLTDTLDKWLTHKIWGLVAFCVIMLLVFQSISTIAKPLMEAFENGQKLVGDGIGDLLPFGLVRSMIVDGAIAGVGGILVFLPQICILFLYIAILEDCGYMARAAFWMDKLMANVGLSGKSFVPLMSSFACAIPGIMATRTIENRRDRMVTILIAPLMSCSARAPVYWVMIAAFFPEVTWAGGLLSLHGLMLFVMTFFGVFVAVPVAWLFKKTLFKGETPPFVLELPSYKWPSFRIVIYRVFERASDFVMQAGTLILATSILIWLASYFPGNHTEQNQVLVQIRQSESEMAEQMNRQSELESRKNEVGDAAEKATIESQLAELVVQLKPLHDLYEKRNEISESLLVNSYLGRFGQLIEPAVQPIGWDWRIGIGVIASFPAREVMVATLGTIYRLGGEVNESHPGLQSALRSATWPDGRLVYSIPVALSIMVFFALCAQCASTLVVIKRETNHWGWAAFAFGYMTTLAYIGAWIAFTIGSAILG